MDEKQLWGDEMKIAYCTNFFPKISESFILNEIVELLERGHDIQIFSIRKPFEKIMHEEINTYTLLKRTHYFAISNIFKENMIKLCIFTIKNIITDMYHMRLSKKSLILDLKLAYFATIMSRIDIDLIHAHFGFIGNYGLRLKQLTNKPLITSFYGIDAAIADTNTYTELFRNCKIITVLSNDMKNDLVNLGCPENKIIIHHLGINLKKFSYSERYKGSIEKIHFLSVGRFVEKKGIMYTIKAFYYLQLEYNNIDLSIIGDGEMRHEIETLIHNLKIQDKVILLGSHSLGEVINEMHRSHIFVLPSITAKSGDKEGTPTVLMEAQATGIPVISTYHAGIPEVVINEKTGYLVEERDSCSLYKIMKYLVEQPGLWNKLGKNGRNHVKEKYNISNQVDKLEIIYKDMIN